MPQTGQETVNLIDEGGKKMKFMVMFQFSTCDMHFGIVKFYGFLSKSFKNYRQNVFSFIHWRVKSANTALKKDSNRIALTVFEKTENNFRGNMD